MPDAGRAVLRPPHARSPCPRSARGGRNGSPAPPLAMPCGSAAGRCAGTTHVAAGMAIGRDELAVLAREAAPAL